MDMGVHMCVLCVVRGARARDESKGRGRADARSGLSGAQHLKQHDFFFFFFFSLS